MATVYCYSGAGGTGDGSSWTNAYTTLAAAVTAAGDGGLVYLSHQHDENSSAAAITIASPGTINAFTRVICVNDGAEPPTALATTGLVRTTGNYSIAINGYLYVYGVTFRASSGGSANATADISFHSAGAAGAVILENCNVEQYSTSASAPTHLGAAASSEENALVLLNSNLYFASASQSLDLLSGTFLWDGGSLLGSAALTGQLILVGGGRQGGRVEIKGVNLSTMTSGYLVKNTGAMHINLRFQNCKLGNGVAIINTAETLIRRHNSSVFVDNCDSGDTNYKLYHCKYGGSITSVTNCYLSAAYSLKMVSLASKTLYYAPLISPPISQWNATVGSALKATVEIISTATLEDDEIWLEIEYLGTSGFPLSSFDQDDRTATHLTSLVSGTGNGTAQTTSAASWTEDLVSEVKQKLVSTSFTPQEAGYVIGRVYLAKADQTVYVDPHITIEAA